MKNCIIFHKYSTIFRHKPSENVIIVSGYANGHKGKDGNNQILLTQLIKQDGKNLEENILKSLNTKFNKISGKL